MIEVKIDGITKWQVNEYTFNDPQMGIRSINMTVKHPSMWVDGTAPDTADFTGAYVDYEGEKYSISSSKPTAEKSNTSLDYIYTLIFKGEEDELTRRKVRNLALVSGDNYVSQGTTFNIYADINQFKQLLENNLKHYFGNKWNIALSVLSSDSVRIDVSNVTLWDLLSKTYEYFGVRFNIRGNTINIGYEPEEIYHVFAYGNDGGLVKITKTAPDTSIVNRLSGMGGSRNVPMNYFTSRYSNFTPDPNPINDTVYIRNIMPKVFRDSVIAGSLPYKDYVEDLDSIAIHGIREDSLAPNEDIYPSIAGVTVTGLGRIDEIVAAEVPEVSDPDDDLYLPTFDIWIKNIGFDLSEDQYTASEDAKIHFTTGELAGYEFVILAVNNVRKVEVDTTKSYGGVSSQYKVTLIKSDEELDAYGQMLPNAAYKAQAGDKFIILGIEMPHSYVLNAEQRVQDWLEANLADLKDEKPTFSIEPMSSFFETAPVEFDGKTIKEKLRAGNKITINADTEQKLHINNLTIQYGGLIPKYSFTVTDKVQVQGGAVARLQSQLDGVMSRQLLTERDIEALLSGFSTKYLSKVKPDTAQQFISFLKGISVKDLVYLAEGLEVGTFSSGALGSGAAVKMIDGTSYAEVDNLTVRQKATFRELIIESLKHIGGQLVLTPARMKCVRVVDGGSFYKCYFDTGDGEVSNEFVAGDFARCQVFTGSGTKFYWRLVTLVGEDWINLSKTSAAVGSDAPEAGDDITQLGNATDTTRQSAIILSTVGIDAPSWKQYSGINSFSLEGKETTVFSKLGNRIQGKTVFTSGGANLNDHLDGVAQDILDALQAAQDAEDKAQQAIEDAEADVATLNEEIGRLQDQIDGKVSNWYYAYSPTLSNYPASDWTTNEIKDSHIGDTFTNTEPAPAENAGKSWRFIKDGSTYSWVVISDSDALKALQEASKAQATADGKSTTYLFQPTKYKLGDMWVLNDDYTINGTAYKQGDLLTATQDSETFNEAHWLKRVRYTDDTKIDNLEIGGGNLITGSKEFQGFYISGHSVEPERYKGFKVYSSKGNWQKLLQNVSVNKGIYSFSCYAKLDETSIKSVGFFVYPSRLQGNIANIKIGNLKEGWRRVSCTVEVDEDIQKGSTRNEGFSVRLEGWSSNADDYKLYQCAHKLEKGNKPTDWTPAPEDVEASIETAKTEAENAAKLHADAQAEAAEVNAKAHADGIVTAEEQARINDVNAKLAAAKAYAEAQDALLKTQQEAYADGKISTAEQAAIQAAKDYADLKKTEAQAYADGIVSDEEARAIADALEKYNASKAHAEQLVDNLEIGGRNYFSPSRLVNLAIVSAGIGGSTSHKSFYLSVNEGEVYSISRTEITNDRFRYAFTEQEPASGGTHFGGTGTATTYDDSLKIEGIIVPANAKYLFLYLTRENAPIPNIKIEKGTKATDWTPAPEDVEASIETSKTEAENAAKAYAEQKAEAERIIAEAYADGIVSDEEQARIDDVNDKLALAKEYAEAQDALLKTQQEAYADGKISTAEQAAIQAAKDYADLKKTEAQAYADGIVSDEEARAIADALEKYNDSKAHAEQLVKDIEIGGRNLIVRHNEIENTWINTRGEIVSNSSTSTMSTYIPVTEGEAYTFSKNTDSSPDGGAFRWRWFDENENYIARAANLSNNFTWAVPSGAYFIQVSYPHSEEAKPKLEKGNKATDWTPAPEDVQAAIDAAVVKATYWSVKASAPVIYKDAINAATSGVHTPVTISGELRSGTTTTSGGFITVTPNGGTEGTATASPVTIAPANGDGKTSYTVRLYDTASKTTLLDTQTIPVVFKGASGANAINVVLGNEADVLPASPEGVVSDYSGSGTTIRVFEGVTELSYGTGNGQYQVSASGSGITAGTPSTSGNTRVYGVASNMTADNATITFTISGKTASGASFSLTKVQAFTKSRTGQKGDGAIEKFKSSATQPSTPTGEAEDWDDNPTVAQQSVLVPTGNNLYDRNYLLARGWLDGDFYIYKIGAGSEETVVPSTKFKANKQYRVQGSFNGGGMSSILTINYSSGLPLEKVAQDGYDLNEITDKNRTVQSITISYGNPSISDNFTVFELVESGTKNLPIWVTRKTIKNEVESAWSTPVKWTGEDGEKGKDGTGINVVGSADTWNNLPTSGNNLNDARIVQDTGVLAVWDGTKWVEAGEIKGPAGDTPYIGGDGYWWIGGTNTGVKAKGDKGDKGDRGDDGEKGKDGTGINVVGSADTWNNLPTSGNNLNDARIVQDTGVLAVWDGTKWVEAGEIKGPAGDTPYIGGNGNWWIGGTDTGIKAEGADGFTITASKDTHSYVTYPGGDIKGHLDAGLIKLSVINGSTVLSCTSTSTSTPNTNGTYRVTNAVTSTGLTITKNISGSQFVLYPATFTADEGTVTLTIVARINNTNHTFTKVVTYNKVSDGSDADMTEYEYLKDAIGQDAELTGALFTLVTILLKESMAADVTAGISGEQGASLDAPAFWAGGTYAQAIANAAKTILRHDGSGHLASGNISWDEEGNVELAGVSTGSSSRVMLSDGVLRIETDWQDTPVDTMRALSSTFAKGGESPLLYRGIKIKLKLPDETEINQISVDELYVDGNGFVKVKK